jgi:hypothetical protein
VNEQTSLLVTGFERVFFICKANRKPPATVVENPGTSTEKIFRWKIFRGERANFFARDGIRKGFLYLQSK